MKVTNCLKVAKRDGQKALAIMGGLRLIDKDLEVDRDKDFLYVPLITKPSEEDVRALEKEVDFETAIHDFKCRKKEESFLDLLKSNLPSCLLSSVPRAMDFIGDIAIVEIPPELDTYRKTIGQAILMTKKNSKTVLAKASSVKGVYRVRDFEVIAGAGRTETIHKESGCRFKVDVTKAYFSPRLSNEHKRIAALVEEGETIVDLFAGVGPFAILIAKTHEVVRIYAIDANPYAVDYLKTNIRLNKVMNKVNALLGDSRQVVKKLSGIADRVIMNLPEKAIEFVDAACLALKKEGGTIHFYCFANVANSPRKMENGLEEAVEKTRGRRIKTICSKTVRETGPHEWQIVIDAQVI